MKGSGKDTRSTRSMFSEGNFSASQSLFSQLVARLRGSANASGTVLFRRDTTRLPVGRRVATKERQAKQFWRSVLCVFVVVCASGCVAPPRDSDRTSADKVIRGMKGYCFEKVAAGRYKNTCSTQVETGLCLAKSLMRDYGCGSRFTTYGPGELLAVPDGWDWIVACNQGKLVAVDGKHYTELYCRDDPTIIITEVTPEAARMRREAEAAEREERKALFSGIVQGLSAAGSATGRPSGLPPSTYRPPSSNSLSSTGTQTNEAPQSSTTLQPHAPAIYNGRTGSTSNDTGSPNSPAACPSRGSTVASLQAHGRCMCKASSGLVYREKSDGYVCVYANGSGFQHGCGVDRSGKVTCTQR